MLATTAAAHVPGAQAFVMLAPLAKAQVDRPQDRSRIEQLLEQRPDVASQLERGDHVALPPAEAELLPPAETASGYSTLVLLPVLYQSSIEALLCLALPDKGAELGSTQMEALRQLCRHAAPAVARLRELETLRHEVNLLRKHAERAADLECALADAARNIEAVEAVSFFKSRRIERFVHDLSSPLQIIDIYSKNLANQADAAAREQAATIREKTQRIIRVMKQFRVLEDVSLHIESFDLRELWKEAVQHVRGSIQEKAIKITERIPAQDFTVHGDRAKLGRVFTDLAVNAAKFAEAGGEISVEFENRGDRVVVKLSDTGVAIPPEVLEKVTDRYAPDAEGESPRTTGFPLIDDYVRLHGGKISVASKVGQGSTFVLELPLFQPHDFQGERKAS